MNIEKIVKNERMLRSVIWIWKKEFEELLPYFEEATQEYYRNIKQTRERGIWWWRKWALPDTKAKLVMILMYVKIYPTYDFVAFLYEVARSQPYYWVIKFLPILEKALWRKLVLPERKTRNLKELLENFPEMKELFVDWTERPINRPKKAKQQKKNYSWKKKRHTVKNTIVADKNRRILFLWETQEWKMHDKKLYDIDSIWEVGIEKYWDTWYIWWRWIITPKKWSKKKPLTDKEKETNKIISSFRVVVENSIAWVKRFGIVSQKLRNKVYWDYQTVKINFKDKVMLISAWLHNLTII